MTIAFARALHRAALVAYPRSFRRQFATELDRIFVERVQCARQQSRLRAVVIAFFQIADAVASGVAERARRAVERWAWPAFAPHTSQSRRNNTVTFDSIRDDLRVALRHAGARRCSPL